MKNSAFIISRQDTSRFNQIKGRDMEGEFRNNELYKIHVTGNGQTVYFASDNGEIQGANTASSSNIIIYLKDRKIQRINFVSKPDAIYYPLSKFPEKESRLENFKWYENYRPVNRNDVFRWDEPYQEVTFF